MAQEHTSSKAKQPRQSKPLSFYPHDLKGVLAATLKVKPQAKKKKDAIENNQRLTSAKVGFQRTRDALKVAKQNFDQAEGHVHEIRSQMAALAEQGEALQAQQRTQQGSRGGARGGSRYGTTSGVAPY